MYKQTITLLFICMLFARHGIAAGINPILFVDGSKPEESTSNRSLPGSPKLKPEEKLLYTTVKIEVEHEDSQISTGTGFIAAINNNADELKHFLVTNRHVIFTGKPIKHIHIYFHLYDCKKHRGYNKSLTKVCKVSFPSNFQNEFAYDTNSRALLRGSSRLPTDICAVYISLLRKNIEEKLEEKLLSGNKANPKLFFEAIDFSGGSTPAADAKLTVSSKIAMVGYPYGYWDDHNNLPILRQGHVASNPRYDYQRNGEFLVDIALYPGSSGSPLFRITTEKTIESFNEENKDLRIQETKKIFFIGLVYGGPASPVMGFINRKLNSHTKLLGEHGDSLKTLETDRGALKKLKEQFKTLSKVTDDLSEDVRDIALAQEDSSSDDEGSRSVGEKFPRGQQSAQPPKRSKQELPDLETDSHKDEVTDEAGGDCVLKQFSNLAYVLKPHIVRKYLEKAYYKRGSTKHSVTQFFIADKLEHFFDVDKKTQKKTNKSLAELLRDRHIQHFEV